MQIEEHRIWLTVIEGVESIVFAAFVIGFLMIAWRLYLELRKSRQELEELNYNMIANRQELKDLNHFMKRGATKCR